MTQESNRMIAEFMGGKRFQNEGWLIERVNGMPKDKGLQYHTSWDWLMPVVEKISKTIIKGHPPFNSDQYVRVEICPNGYVKIENLRDTPINTNVSIEGSLIAAVYKAVTQFITWYNTTKQ